MTLAEYLDMGGYALYVWPAYALSIVGLAGLIILSWRRMKAAERRAAASREATEPGK